MVRPNVKAIMNQLWQRPWFRVAVVLAAIVVVIAVVYALYWVPWFGFGGYTDSEGKWQHHKTFWDWMELLIVPAGIALAALWFDRRIQKREREAEDRRARELSLVSCQVGTSVVECTALAVCQGMPR